MYDTVHSLSIVLTEFLLLVGNPLGETPQDSGSEPPSPDPIRTREINSLLRLNRIVRDQEALKKRVCIGLLPTVPLQVTKCCLGPSPGWP